MFCIPTSKRNPSSTFIPILLDEGGLKLSDHYPDANGITMILISGLKVIVVYSYIRHHFKPCRLSGVSICVCTIRYDAIGVKG